MHPNAQLTGYEGSYKETGSKNMKYIKESAGYRAWCE